jgi:hypothetical protein
MNSSASLLISPKLLYYLRKKGIDKFDGKTLLDGQLSELIAELYKIDPKSYYWLTNVAESYKIQKIKLSCAMAIN